MCHAGIIYIIYRVDKITGIFQSKTTQNITAMYTVFVSMWLKALSDSCWFKCFDSPVCGCYDVMCCILFFKEGCNTCWFLYYEIIFIFLTFLLSVILHRNLTLILLLHLPSLPSAKVRAGLLVKLNPSTGGSHNVATCGWSWLWVLYDSCSSRHSRKHLHFKCTKRRN